MIHIDIKYQLRNGNVNKWIHKGPYRIGKVMHVKDDMDIFEVFLPESHEPVIALGYVNEKEVQDGL